mmetsp:Transcript_10217/g.15458  ORF Transcript_10217/g.15458 Transcript_10217/m.15458 type:complete len:310 (+) Transcript_10217:542-1471(+)
MRHRRRLLLPVRREGILLLTDTPAIRPIRVPAPRRVRLLRDRRRRGAILPLLPPVTIPPMAGITSPARREATLLSLRLLRGIISITLPRRRRGIRRSISIIISSSISIRRHNCSIINSLLHLLNTCSIINNRKCISSILLRISYSRLHKAMHHLPEDTCSNHHLTPTSSHHHIQPQPIAWRIHSNTHNRAHRYRRPSTSAKPPPNKNDPDASAPSPTVPIASYREACASPTEPNARSVPTRDVPKTSKRWDCAARTVRRASDARWTGARRSRYREDGALRTERRKSFAAWRDVRSRVFWEGCVRSITMR